MNASVKPFIEELPAEVEQRLRGLKPDGESVLIQVATDMAGRERFAQRWLVVTERQVLFLQADGVDGVIQLPMEAIKTARVEPLVGGGYLEVECRQGAPAQLYYSNSMSAKFAEVAEGICQLAKGEQPVLPTEVELSHCGRCGRLLPEKNGICPACIRKLDTLKRLLRYMAPHRLKVVVMISITVAAAALELVPPYVVKTIIDDVLNPTAGPQGAALLSEDARFELLGLLVAGLLGINLVSWVIQIVRRWLNTWVGFRAVEALRADLYQCLQYLPLRFYDKRKVGAMISRMTNDSDMVEGYLIFDMPFVVSNALIVVGVLFLLLYLDWHLTLYVLLPVVPIVVGSKLIWARLEGYWRRWGARWSRLSAHLNESIAGIRVVKAFAQEDRESERFDRRNHALRQISVSAERSWLVFFLITNFIMNFGGFFVWYFGGRKVLGEALTLGVLMAFISYLWKLYQPLRWFGDFYSFMVRAFAGAERIFEVIDARSEPVRDPEAIPMPALEGRVQFKSASFGYDPGKPVLKEVDLEVAAGEMIGLVGRSGAGKSTLVNLICRFYDVTRGSVEIDGLDIRKIRLEDLRRQIGLVAQQPFLFNGTIADNIGYGKPGAGFADIMRAARAANAHEFIVAKPDGYDTKVGEQGNKLAGGEKQRLAIARAILHDPRILILDEATSSLDTPTEKKIQEAIARLVEGRTTFAIAHRLSTLRTANRLVVLDTGKIAEVGSHAELMAREGVFYNLAKTQQATSAVMAVGGSKAGPA
jgi:ATP-binding cassette subfamily B protein